ncbi:MAG TPA: hypothetical protein DCS93_11780 [Microscillaceae bacterium]|nr:hypothetical protein [Microscillaceae bacterium]
MGGHTHEKLSGNRSSQIGDLGDDNTFEEKTYFEETIDLEGTDIEKTDLDGTDNEGTDFEEDDLIYQNGPENGKIHKKTTHKFFEPITRKIDVDGDQIPELEVTFTALDAKRVQAKIIYLPTGADTTFTFAPLAGTKGLQLYHQDPSDGVVPHRFYFNEPDYTKVFYASQKKWGKSYNEKAERRRQYIDSFAKLDTLPSEDLIKANTEFVGFLSVLDISFKPERATNSYAYFIEFEDSNQTWYIQDHEFEKSNLTGEGQIVHDQTETRTEAKQAKDRKVSSFTVPIAVGRKKQHKFMITFEKHQDDDKGIANISVDKWLGTRKIPIPSKFADLKRPIVTEKTNHLEIRFKGAYDTVLRIHERYQLIEKGEEGDSDDEVFALIVHTDALPDVGQKKASSDAKKLCGRTSLITYKIQYIDGSYKAYHNTGDDYTDEGEFEQHATQDARLRISNQSDSHSEQEELLNIEIRELRLIEAYLRDKSFIDVGGQPVSGSKIFMDYLDLVIAVRRMGNQLAVSQEANKQSPSWLAMRKDAEKKAIRFLYSGYPTIKKTMNQMGIESPVKKKSTGPLVLDPSKMRHHDQPKELKITLPVEIENIALFLRDQQWTKVKDAIRSFHRIFEDMTFLDKKTQVEELFEEKAKKEAATISDPNKKKEAERQARIKNSRDQAEAIKGVAAEFNMDKRYKAFVKQKQTPEKVHKVKALFYPEHLNVGPDIKEPVSIELPLYYYQKDGHWHLVSLVNKAPGNTFTSTESTKVKAGEKHPPFEMFTALDRDDHLPKGILYYEIPGGDSKKIHITSKTPWWKYAGYVALTLFAIGLALYTGGLAGGAIGAAAESIAGTTFFLAGAVGATGAVCNIIDDSYQDKLTLKSIVVNGLDIVGAFIGALKLFKIGTSVKAANATKLGTEASHWGKIGLKSLNARYRYILLEKLDLGVDATMVVIGSVDGFAQVISVMEGPGTLSQKTEDILKILPLLVLQGALFLGTVKGRRNNIKDAEKGKILGAVAKASPGGGKGEGNAPPKSAIEVDPKVHPGLAKLRDGGIFSKESVDEVLALIRRPEDFESVAKAIAKLDQTKLKGLSARFSEKDVLYLLYYFDGNLSKVHLHLLKNKGRFGDKGHQVYHTVREYEFLKSKVENPKDIQNTTKYKLQADQLKQKFGEAKQAQEAEAQVWNQKRSELNALKKQQKIDQEKLENTGTEIRAKQQALAKQEIQEEKFGKLTEGKKMINEEGVESWQQGQQNRLNYQKQELNKLVKVEQKQAQEMTRLQEAFEAKQMKEADQFYKKMGKIEHEQKQILKNDKTNKAALDRLAKQDEEIDAFIKKQEKAAKEFEQKQQERRTQLKNTRQQLDQQQARVDQHQRLGKQYQKAAQAIKEGIELRKQISKLQDQRGELLTKVQETEKQIMNLRLQLNQLGASKASLRRQIQELTATKNEQQALVVQKDMEIAMAEEKLAKLAKDENAYSLDIQKSIKGELSAEKIGELLDKNVAPKDIGQLEQFVDQQAKRVQSFTDKGRQAGKQYAIEKENLKQKNNTKTGLENQKRDLERDIARLTPQIGSSSHIKPIKGKKTRRNKGGAPKRQSIMKRLTNAQTELNNVQAQLKKLEPELKKAQNDTRHWEAKQKINQAKATQEQAKLEVYKEFLALQEKIAKGRKNLQASEQAYDQFRKKLNQSERQLRRTDVKAGAYRAPQKQALDEAVNLARVKYETAQKRFDTHRLSRRDYKRKYKVAKQNYEALQSLQKSQQAAEAEQAARGEKLTLSFKTIHQAAVKLVKQHSKPPAMKAWWKICKIGRKLLKPSGGPVPTQEAAALLQITALEKVLDNHLTDKSLPTLPNNEADLWKMLYAEIEKSGSSYYASGQYSSLLQNLRGIQQHNAKLLQIQVEIRTKEQQLRNLQKVAWKDQELSQAEEVLLEALDEAVSLEEGRLSQKQIEEIKKMVEQIQKEQETDSPKKE